MPDLESSAGSEANEIFLIQQIDRIIADVAKVTDGLEIDNVNLIDGGDGRTLARYVGGYPAVVAEIFERIKDTVGIDVVSILTKPNNEPPKKPAFSPTHRQSLAKESEVR